MSPRGLRALLAASATVLRGIAPWCFLWLGCKLFFVLGWFPEDRHLTWSWWTWALSRDLGNLLPFLAFAGGVRLVPEASIRGRIMGTVLPVALALAALSYALDAWVSPALRYRHLADTDVVDVDARRFGPETPGGILRNLRFVEASPPDEYSLRVVAPHEAPPNVLRWRLHRPVAHATFGMLSLLMGILTAQATAGMRQWKRRNVRLAVGVFGGMGFFACVLIASPTVPFLREGTLQSGILSAWAPLVLPLCQFCVLLHLARKSWWQ